jgi:D-xylose 1-dehydrogenase (NADP+, D-xylono-1,5-lactone-forming)
MKKTIRWGLLSTARINRSLIPAIRAAKRGELAAVASRDLEKSRAYAEEWKIPRAFGSYEDMLNSDEVDAVYISLPNHLHAEWTVKALRAGKHVLCEKPFAISTEEVDQVVAASRETGGVAAEAFMYRHHPQTKLVGEWVKSGRLGEISLVRAVFNFSMGNRSGNVRLVPDYGGGALWDVGVYPVSYAQFIMGEVPQWVSGSQYIGSDSGVDETFSGQLHYSGDRVAQISCSFRTPFYASLDILGTEGRLHLNHPFTRLDASDREMTFFPAEGKPQKVRVPKKETYLGEVEDMHAAILDGAPSYIRLEESRNHVRTVQALYSSASSGQTIKLE